MISVVQMFKKKALFDKTQYFPTTRSNFRQWPSYFNSMIGYLENNDLILPEQMKDDRQLNSSTIFLVDTIVDNQLQFSETSAYHFCNYNNKRAIEIFTFNQIDNDKIEIHTRFQGLSHMSTIPVRSNHKIGLLKPGDSICFRTNDRYDFSYVSRRNKTYIEYDYIIQFRGVAQSITFKTTDEIAKEKLIDYNSCKLIEELKILY